MSTNYNTGSIQIALRTAQGNSSTLNLAIYIGLRLKDRNSQMASFSWKSSDACDPRNMDIELAQYYNEKFGKPETNE